MFLSRIAAMIVVMALVVLTFLGCGEGPPQFDPATRYSPESLAKELVFQIHSLDPNAKGNVVVEEVPDTRKTAATREPVTTKKGPATTLQALLDDIVEKAGSVPNSTRSQACKKVAEILAQEPSISEADKKTIADRLGVVKDH